MVLRSVSVALLCAALASPVTTPASAAPRPDAGVCPKLAADYDQIEKALAMTFAEGSMEGNAASEANRQLVASNYLAQASITITLMQANRCPLPDHAPSVQRYFSAALACATDRQKEQSPASCKTENWKPTQ